jgi:hypothetical protein
VVGLVLGYANLNVWNQAKATIRTIFVVRSPDATFLIAFIDHGEIPEGRQLVCGSSSIPATVETHAAVERRLQELGCNELAIADAKRQIDSTSSAMVQIRL